jgi:protein arginine N-methyltransferase 1
VSDAYKIYDYGGMILDEGRSRAYAESLKHVVTADSVVLDIGAGTGFLALLAAQLGARKVYAIEPSDAVQFGQRAAAQNGLDRRVEFIKGLSFDIDLPEKVDVIVSDLHGVLPAYRRGLSSIIDARDRFLARGGALIPSRETLWAAIVEAPRLHHEVVGVWGLDVLGLDLTPMRAAAMNTWHKTRLTAPDLVTVPACWATLEYQTLQSPDVRGELLWKALDRRSAHGICVWFDWEGAEGIGFSNSPLSGERHIFGQAFFPWPEPLDLCAGDEVRVQLRADAVQSSYIYRWETRVDDAHGQTKAVFQQSDFFGTPLSVGRLQQLTAHK